MKWVREKYGRYGGIRLQASPGVYFTIRRDRGIGSNRAVRREYDERSGHFRTHLVGIGSVEELKQRCEEQALLYVLGGL